MSLLAAVVPPPVWPSVWGFADSTGTPVDAFVPPSTAVRIAVQSSARHQLNSSTVLMTVTGSESSAATNSGREYTAIVLSDGCSLCWWLTIRTPSETGSSGRSCGQVSRCF